MPDDGRLPASQVWLMRELWDLYSRVYDGLLSFWPYTNLIARSSMLLQARDGDRVLDVGCGTGNLLFQLSRNSQLDLTGVDASARMLEIARSKLMHCSEPVAQLHQTDALAYLAAQPSASFDRIATTNLLYAVERPDDLWQELLRLLRPHGLIVASTSVKKGNLGIIREHLRNAGLRQLIGPKLLAVFAIDCLIGLLGLTKQFPFPDEAALRQSVSNAGAIWVASEAIYGGANILFSVRKDE